MRTDTGEKTKGKYQNRYAVSFLNMVYLLISPSHKELMSMAGNVMGSAKLSKVADPYDTGGWGMVHCGFRGTRGP